MLREKIVFGPIKSRRLGSSLGINLLPENGKVCNFDCIYCECGWNRDGLDDRRIPTKEELRSALTAKLSECRDASVEIDSITFSGDGEPILNPEFPEIIDITVELRDKYYPKARVSVLSNATNISDERVFIALKKVDSPILKLDAPTTELVRLINRPVGNYEVSRIVEAMKRFNGDFILQTMFLRAPFFDSFSQEVLLPWMDIVRDVKPREIMAYTIARPTPHGELGKVTAAEMREKLDPLFKEGFNIKIYE